MLNKSILKIILVFCLIVILNFIMFYGIFTLYGAIHP